MKRALATIGLALVVGFCIAPVIAEQLPHKPTTTERVSKAHAEVVAAPPVVTTAPGTTITTSAPVTSSTKIDVGTYAGQALMWVASVFGSTIGAALTALILRLLKNAGIQGSEMLRSKLQDIIVNGLNAGAREASARLQDRGQIDVKNVAVANAVTYVQQHGADTLKQLGIDPTGPEAIEAIKARIETAINDPTVPTPPILDATKKV